MLVVALPDSVISIGDYAFRYCKSLTSINLPANVTTIGEAAFKFCDQLTITVVRESYAAEYCKEKGLNYTYTDSLDWLKK